MPAVKRKPKTAKTPEQMVDAWIAGQAKADGESRAAILERWEAGASNYVTVPVYGANYEQAYLADYDLPGSGYVVIEWDDSGNLGICF